MSTWDDKPNDYEHALEWIERLRAENLVLRDIRGLFRELQNIMTAVDGINDERDSVPILLAVRDVVNRAPTDSH